MDAVWLILVCSGLVVAFAGGRTDAAVTEALRSASTAVHMMLEFLGAMCLWLGLMKIAERSGLTSVVCRLVSPFIRRLLRGVPPGHPALEAVSMSFSANLLGLGGAATPLGLKAMKELRDLSREGTVASSPMCTFVAMVCSGFTLVPGGIVAVRAQMGSREPTAVVGPTLLAGIAALTAALWTDAVLRSRWRGRA
ncbi:MAG: spore maturation protein [Firmicutes bacterium]|nr:spore maturation protein [Bacillota bacterium]